MSYDIYLRDPATKDVLKLDHLHYMRGGTFSVGGTEKCWINITYNYANYYYDAAGGDPRFCNENGKCLGIRGIYGKSGAESIPMIKDMVQRILEKYKENDCWIGKEAPTDDYWEETAGNAIRPLYQLLALAQMRPDGVWDGD